ncbi:hypothetical protein FQA47_013209 [Oryzias melastigma]|uniref:Uncharacterized protein n=1 Tax=Oryzias melastigma TaxID=30732 RepID=A0A834FHI3_ORYME|nr:hypothetical protein FQA47_013209 [Oryzias melastigma]
MKPEPREFSFPRPQLVGQDGCWGGLEERERPNRDFPDPPSSAGREKHQHRPPRTHTGADSERKAQRQLQSSSLGHTKD